MYWKWQGCFNFHFVLCCSSTFLSRKETYYALLVICLPECIGMLVFVFGLCILLAWRELKNFQKQLCCAPFRGPARKQIHVHKLFPSSFQKELLPLHVHLQWWLMEIIYVTCWPIQNILKNGDSIATAVSTIHAIDFSSKCQLKALV